MDYQQGAVFSSIVLTYTPIENINEASRVPSLRKPAGTGKPSTASIVSAGNSYTGSRERVVHKSRQNHRHGCLFRVHVDNFCRRRWCVWELAKMTRHQKRWHHYCWRPPRSGTLRRCSYVLRVSVHRAYGKMLGAGVCAVWSAAWSQSSMG